jgi:hypothetical protein
MYSANHYSTNHHTAKVRGVEPCWMQNGYFLPKPPPAPLP